MVSHRRTACLVTLTLCLTPLLAHATWWKLGFSTIDHQGPWPTIVLQVDEMEHTCKHCREYVAYELKDTRWGDTIVVQLGKHAGNKQAEPVLMIRSLTREWCTTLETTVKSTACSYRVTRVPLGTPVYITIVPNWQTTGVTAHDADGNTLFANGITGVGFGASRNVHCDEGDTGDCADPEQRREDFTLSVYGLVFAPYNHPSAPAFVGHATVPTEAPEQWLPVDRNPNDFYVRVGPVTNFTVALVE